MTPYQLHQRRKMAEQREFLAAHRAPQSPEAVRQLGILTRRLAAIDQMLIDSDMMVKACGDARLLGRLVMHCNGMQLNLDPAMSDKVLRYTITLLQEERMSKFKELDNYNDYKQ